MPSPGKPAPALEGTCIDASVLLVEDNEINQLLAVTVLEALGCRVDLAADGAEAVAALQARSYDAVLMDCQMPTMDGFEATRLIRAAEDGEHHQLIVALTANAMESDRQACLVAGMDDYLAKPFTADQLRETLARWLGLAGRAAGSTLEPVTEPWASPAPGAPPGEPAARTPDRPTALRNPPTTPGRGWVQWPRGRVRPRVRPRPGGAGGMARRPALPVSPAPPPAGPCSGGTRAPTPPPRDPVHCHVHRRPVARLGRAAGRPATEPGPTLGGRRAGPRSSGCARSGPTTRPACRRPSGP